MELMRQVVSSPASAKAVGLAAREHVVRNYSLAKRPRLNSMLNSRTAHSIFRLKSGM